MKSYIEVLKFIFPALLLLYFIIIFVNFWKNALNDSYDFNPAPEPKKISSGNIKLPKIGILLVLFIINIVLLFL